MTDKSYIWWLVYSKCIKWYSRMEPKVKFILIWILIWFKSNIKYSAYKGKNSCLRKVKWDLLLVLHTWSMRAWGVWTKYETFPFGADWRHSWLSVATGLYMNTMALDNFPSYSTWTNHKTNKERCYKKRILTCHK